MKKGDLLGVQCDFENIRNQTVSTGFTRRDEMCAAYLVYYIKSNSFINSKSYCLGGRARQALRKENV